MDKNSSSPLLVPLHHHSTSRAETESSPSKNLPSLEQHSKEILKQPDSHHSTSWVLLETIKYENTTSMKIQHGNHIIEIFLFKVAFQLQHCLSEHGKYWNSINNIPPFSLFLCPICQCQKVYRNIRSFSIWLLNLACNKCMAETCFGNINMFSNHMLPLAVNAYGSSVLLIAISSWANLYNGVLLSLLPKIDATITFYHSILSLAMQDGYFHTLTLFVIIFLWSVQSWISTILLNSETVHITVLNSSLLICWFTYMSSLRWSPFQHVPI